MVHMNARSTLRMGGPTEISWVICASMAMSLVKNDGLIRTDGMGSNGLGDLGLDIGDA
jgi:hypothetical protein